MSWIEFNHKVECIHCGEDQWECFEFNTTHGDESGITSPYREFECNECDKKFWSRARLSFDIDVVDNLKRKPKDLA